jgi:hypothetical protein
MPVNMRCRLVVLSAVFSLNLLGQTDETAIEAPKPVAPLFQDDRIFGLIPAFQVVQQPDARLAPLTPKQKLELFAKETFDPFTIFGAVAGATFSHITQGDPQYGQGSRAYRQRVGAAYLDLATQNFFGDALLATIFKEDPRYYRLGPEHSFLARLGYSVSRVVVTRTDSGKNRFSFASVLGTGMGIALSNAYYPQSDHNRAEMVSRVETSFTSSAVSNLLPEFWPDIKERVARLRKSRKPPAP